MTLSPEIEAKARAVADEKAARMRQRLDRGETPMSMGWPRMTAAEMVSSEWRAWFEFGLIHHGAPQ